MTTLASWENLTSFWAILKGFISNLLMSSLYCIPEQTILTEVFKEGQIIKKPIHCPLLGKFNSPSWKSMALQSQTGANAPLIPKQLSVVDSFCCSSFRNTNNVTRTSKACGSLKWKSLASLCLTHCASFRKMNRSLWHKISITTL